MKSNAAVNTAQTTSAPALTLRISGVTPAESRVQQNFSGLMDAFRALSMTQKVGWQNAANIMNLNEGRTGRHKLSAANAYFIIGSGCLALRQFPPTDAPASLAPPPMLVNVSLTSAAPAAEAQPGTAPFSLLVYAPTYTNPVQVLAAPPAIGGKPTFPATSFAPITLLDTIPPDGIDISSDYAARYGVPDIGAQIGLKLIAMTPQGVRRVPLVISGIVTAAT